MIVNVNVNYKKWYTSTFLGLSQSKHIYILLLARNNRQKLKNFRPYFSQKANFLWR